MGSTPRKTSDIGEHFTGAKACVHTKLEFRSTNIETNSHFGIRFSRFKTVLAGAVDLFHIERQECSIPVNQ